MKTYEITYSNGNGIYSANLVIAESAEQAAAYYTAKGREVIGCDETMSRPKPGQPIVTVPEGWTAPAAEPETEAKTAETTETAPATEPEAETGRETEQAERDERIADIMDAVRREIIAGYYRRKQRATAKCIREAERAGAPTVHVGYCDAQYLLSGIEPDYYTTGVYGWNCDIYRIAGLTICTGYRGMIGVPAVDTAEYERKARIADTAEERIKLLAEWIAANLDAIQTMREGVRI